MKHQESIDKIGKVVVIVSLDGNCLVDWVTDHSEF